RSTGMTYRQIAKVQKVHVATAFARVQRAIERQKQAAPETLAEARVLLEMKLDRMERAIMPRAAMGDHAAIRLVLRSNELRLRWMKEEGKQTVFKQNKEQALQVTPLPVREGLGEGQAADCRDAQTVDCSRHVVRPSPGLSPEGRGVEEGPVQRTRPTCSRER